MDNNKEMRDAFFEYIGSSTSLYGYVKSYKLIFFRTFFFAEKFERRINVKKFTEKFLAFYYERQKEGLQAELDSDSILFYPDRCTLEEVFKLILNNPFKVISEKKFFRKEYDGNELYFAMMPELYEELTFRDLLYIKNTLSRKIELYFSRRKSSNTRAKRRMKVGTRRERFTTKELNELFVNDIGSFIIDTGNLSAKPLIVRLASPFLCKFKVYMFNCTCPPGGRSADEYKSQLIIEGQKRNNRGYLDDTDGTIILLIGYATPFENKYDGVYVLWDAEEHRIFAYSANLQTKLDLILQTTYKDIVLQTKKSGEIVVLSNRKNLKDALLKRLRLYSDRLLGD